MIFRSLMPGFSYFHNATSVEDWEITIKLFPFRKYVKIYIISKITACELSLVNENFCLISWQGVQDRWDFIKVSHFHFIKCHKRSLFAPFPKTLRFYFYFPRFQLYRKLFKEWKENLLYQKSITFQHREILSQLY